MTDYVIPDFLEMPITESEVVENLAMFVLHNTGDLWGIWTGRMTAKDQRKLFGRFIGKGRLTINSAKELVIMSVKVCFGTDSNYMFYAKWGEVLKSKRYDEI